MCENYIVLLIIKEGHESDLTISKLDKYASMSNSLKDNQSNTYSIRSGTKNDLPDIHIIIRESFLAMVPHSCLGRQFWVNMADQLINTELNEDNFEKMYFDKETDNHFWVIENSNDNNVIGCVGLKRIKSENSAELVRMGIKSELRGSGIGSLLIQTLINYCKDKQDINQIHLTTGNPLSVKFYQKNGFKDYNYFMFHKCVYQCNGK